MHWRYYLLNILWSYFCVNYLYITDCKNSMVVSSRVCNKWAWFQIGTFCNQNPSHVFYLSKRSFSSIHMKRSEIQSNRFCAIKWLYVYESESEEQCHMHFLTRVYQNIQHKFRFINVFFSRVWNTEHSTHWWTFD